MNSLPDSSQVIEIMEAAAAAEIMPRFRHLSGDDIREKSPGDPVTVADIGSERYLSEHLTALVTGSLVVGEEGADDDPEILERIGGDAPVWILDPLDGTGNFSRGQTPFVVIVAYVEGGETRAGWIHDPVTGETISAAKGHGAYSNKKLDAKRLTVPAPPPLREMTGSLSKPVARRLKDLGDEKDLASRSSATQRVRHIRRVNCVGRDYMDLALGDLHFSRYGFRLKPWDHAAGVLIHAEAGGYSRLVRSNTAYAPTLPSEQAMKTDEILFMAPDMASWETLTKMLADG
jgi:fructose-1,6-bisphosphatase/inositol monophosphatase family enzyme